MVNEVSMEKKCIDIILSFHATFELVGAPASLQNINDGRGNSFPCSEETSSILFRVLFIFYPSGQFEVFAGCLWSMEISFDEEIVRARSGFFVRMSQVLSPHTSSGFGKGGKKT